MTVERARHILNREAGFDKYSRAETAMLLAGLEGLLSAVRSVDLLSPGPRMIHRIDGLEDEASRALHQGVDH